MHARLRMSLPVRPVDLNAPGAIDELLAFHRAQFGDARMDDGDDDDQDDDTGTGGDDKDDDDADSDADSDDDKDDKPLGPKGEKALEAEKTKRRAAQAQLREWNALGLTAAEVSKRLAALPAGDKDDKTPDADAIRKEIKAEVDAERQRERVLDKIEAKAARLFADPDDAAALLLRGKDVNDFLDGDGKIDVGEIEDGLEALLKKKPYLAAQGGKRFKGGGDGGARKEQQPKAKSLQDAVAARIAAGKT